MTLTPSFVSAQGSNGTASPRTVTMPASLAVGNRVVAEVNVFSTTAFTWPSGWNALVASNYISSNGRCEIRYYDIVDSSALSALGSSISVTTGTGVSSHMATQIHNVDFGTAPEGAANTPANPAPDPPSLNPAGWGTEESFWMAHLSHRNNSTGYITAAPSGYTNLNQENKNDDATFGVGQGSASKVATAASDDPAAFSTLIGAFQVAFTTVHRPKQLVPITITGTNNSKTYGNSDPSLAASVTSGSLNGGDSLTGTPSRDAGENVGAYDITQGTVSVSNAGDYDITWVDGTFTVNARALTVASDAKSKTYGDSDPAFTAQITSGSLATVTSTDSISDYGLTRAAGEPSGTYAITPDVTILNGSAVDVTANYTLTQTPANLTVNDRSVTITAANKSKVEGDSDPALTASVTSGTLAFSDALSGALTRDAGEDVGVYDITVGSLTITSSPHAGNAANYTITFVEGALTIAALPPAAGPGFSLATSIGIR